MFSDTHFHFCSLDESCGVTRAEILRQMAGHDCRFGLDIGTRCDDLPVRQETVIKAAGILDEAERNKVLGFYYFTAGIWPSPEAIRDRFNQMKILEKNISSVMENGSPFEKKICALGEFGLDHHWNPSGVDGRNESDFDQDMYHAEAELFEMQLELCKKTNLPAIIHSRDAFDDTVSCLKNAGWHNGVIHCYSYGKREAEIFLDMGWYLAFGGAVTYAKKSKMEEMAELLRYVPADRLLIETDSPYLSPVPLRGKPNNPLNIEHTYRFIAERRGISVEDLCELTDRNIASLFKVNIL